MRVTVPVPNPARANAPGPEPIHLKYVAASEGGRSIFAVQFKDKRPLVKGDRDTEVSDYNRLRAFWDRSKGTPYALWINAMTIIVGRGEPPAIPAESFMEGMAANREILNWVESRCIVLHMEEQAGVMFMASMFPYPNNIPAGTEPWVGFTKAGDFGLGLKNIPGYVEATESGEPTLYTREGLKKLNKDQLADLAVRMNIIDALPTWGHDRLISEILAKYKESTKAEELETAAR